MSLTTSSRPMWIAPSRYPDIRYWTVDHWKALTFTTEGDWKAAIEIFEDRIQYRYLDAIEVMQENDNQHYRQHKQRRFGFAMMALDCLLIETLAQFYTGVPESPKKENRKFYIAFLSNKSFVLKQFFDTEQLAEAFYDTIRCGILHQAETKEDSRIRFFDDENYADEPFELLKDGKSLKIYWANFHPKVRSEFETYCAHLRANDMTGLRKNFRQKMDFICRAGSV